MNVLSSCKKAKSVKRVVLTSSCSSIRYRYDVQQVSPLNESHWSDIDYCKEYNVMQHLHISANFSISHKHSLHLSSFKLFIYVLHYIQLWYAYAKTIAEKDAWDVAKENGIDLVVVNPSYVVGPLLAPQPTSTLLMILAYITGTKRNNLGY